MYIICIWRYPVDLAVHHNIHYITFTILVRETCNDYLNSHALFVNRDGDDPHASVKIEKSCCCKY